jgi:acyl-CoA synthetase (AMP-forming)/AMP-acid ligase II
VTPDGVGELLGGSWRAAVLHLEGGARSDAASLVEALDAAFGDRPSQRLAVTGTDPCAAAVAALWLQADGHDVIVAGQRRRLAIIGGALESRGAQVGDEVERQVAGSAGTVVVHRIFARAQSTLPEPDGRVVFATSGTTGPPKLVGFTAAQVGFIVAAVAARLGYRAEDRVASPVPISFDYGFYQVALALHAGCEIAVRPAMALPRTFLDLLDGFPATVVPVTPAFARSLLANADPARAVHGVRLVTSTGAPFLAALQRDLAALFPGAATVPMYGVTECKRVSIATAELVHAKPHSVGLPLDGTTVRIVDKSGAELPAGVTGEALVRGPHVAHGYYGGAEDPTLAQDSDGSWTLRTGDVMSRDADGALYYHGRAARDFVKVLDERVSLPGVEEALRSLAPVTEARVRPTYDDDGLVMHLDATVVVVAPGMRAEEAVRRVRREVGAAAASRLRITVVSSISLSDNGKVGDQ